MWRLLTDGMPRKALLEFLVCETEEEPRQAAVIDMACLDSRMGILWPSGAAKGGRLCSSTWCLVPVVLLFSHLFERLQDIFKTI